MSEQIRAESKFVELDPDTETIHRLSKWAFNPRNDKDPLALAVRVLFADRGRCRGKASDLSKVVTVLRDDLKFTRATLAQYQKRFGGHE